MDIIDDFVIVSRDDIMTASEAPCKRDREPDYFSDIDSFVDGIADVLWPVNKKIHDNPELGYKEFIAHDVLTSFMRSRRGWEVTSSAYGMATAWVAVYDSGKVGPVVSFNAEMDALPGIGHACGHNLIASASVAGALASAEMMQKHHLSGKVVLFGTPAEEGGGGKIRLLNAGAYKSQNISISLISHPGTVHNSALVRTSAYTRFRTTYTGRAAHAAAAPWEGINALDALVAAYNGLAALRQTLMPGEVVHGIVSEGGTRANIIPAKAAGVFVARARARSRLDILRKRVGGCFQAGATATGAELQVVEEGMYKDHVPNRVLGEVYARWFNALLGDGCEDVDGGRIPVDQDVDELKGATMASTDQGDVSYAMPSLSPGFAIEPGRDGGGPHSPDFAESTGTRDSFNRSLRVGKALAGTAIEVLTREGMLEEVREAWKRDMEARK